jgi:hypothetical protein
MAPAHSESYYRKFVATTKRKPSALGVFRQRPVKPLAIPALACRRD